MAFGWPWVYGRSYAPTTDAFKHPSWLKAAAWRHVFQQEEVNLRLLVADVGVCLVGLALVAGLVEWRRRRRIRFWQTSLRELGIVVTLIAIAAAWFGSELQCHERELAAIARIDGNFVHADWYNVAPDWFFRLTGWLPPPLDHVISIEADSAGAVPVDDRFLKTISECRYLESLSLDSDSITDEGLVNLTSLKSLEFLAIAAPISDQGLETIAQIDSIETLLLTEASITDSGISRLAELHELRLLQLSGIEISDDAVPHFARLQRLENLYIDGTNMTTVGLRELASRLPECEIYPEPGDPDWPSMR
jgi:hypothetical protein